MHYSFLPSLYLVPYKVFSCFSRNTVLCITLLGHWISTDWLKESDMVILQFYFLSFLIWVRILKNYSFSRIGIFNPMKNPLSETFIYLFKLFTLTFLVFHQSSTQISVLSLRVISSGWRMISHLTEVYNYCVTHLKLQIGYLYNANPVFIFLYNV